MCCYLEALGVHLGRHYPRFWQVCGQYKNAARIIAGVVLILQLVRISMIAFQSSFAYENYPQSETIGFCALSIFLGVASLGLETFLLYAIQKNNIQKIQPWFLCTLIIFLVASLAFVITSTLYIIRPIDHNASLLEFLKKNRTLEENIQNNMSAIINPEMPNNMDMMDSNNLSLNNTADECSWNNNTCNIISAQNGTSRVVYPENVVKRSVGMDIKDGGVPVQMVQEVRSRKSKRKERPPCVIKTLEIQNEFYLVEPSIPLSFLLDVVRCIPQLFLVNRFVKVEQLHVHLIHQSHSHTSLSALYVKPLPLPVLV